MNRSGFQRLARVRLQEAKILLENGKYDGAYYLSGYAVEFGLKACIAKRTKRYDFPDRGLVNAAYLHDLNRLCSTAGLDAVRDAEFDRDSDFEFNWLTVAKKWSEGSRYEVWGRKQAEELVVAIADRRHGVLRWIKLHW